MAGVVDGGARSQRQVLVEHGQVQGGTEGEKAGAKRGGRTKRDKGNNRR